MVENAEELFQEIGPGMTPNEVRGLLGDATRESEKVVPEGSGWGTQSSFWLKILPGQPYLELVYSSGTTDFTIWFAREYGKWSTAMKLPLPRNV